MRGGAFTTAGGNVVNYVAKWNGSSWSALGSGMGGGGIVGTFVKTLAMMGSDLYAGGHFTTAGGIAATNIAKWNGVSWSALGSGLGSSDPQSNMSVSALAISGSDLYAGGDFDSYIARWDGSGWSRLGLGMSGPVLALAVSGTNLYAGGDFSLAGGVQVNNIAKWDGSSWSRLGSGMNQYGYVRALAVSDADLYAGGAFSTAGGRTANAIAKWDGSNWSALSSGMSGGTSYRYVSALAVSGGDLYVGGNFTTAGGLAATNIAKWDGNTWAALGSGINSNVSALAVAGSNLYAGGSFLMAGGKVSAYLTKATFPPVLVIEADRSGGYFIRFTGSPGVTYSLQRAPTVTGPWSISAAQVAPASGLVEFWELDPPSGQAFYRTVQP